MATKAARETENDSKKTLNDLRDAFHAAAPGTYSDVRAYAVKNKKRSGAPRAFIGLEHIDDLEMAVAFELPPGVFNIELHRADGNFGPQCEIEIETDMRPPHKRMQASPAPAPQAPHAAFAPPWQHQPPPYWQQQQQPYGAPPAPQGFISQETADLKIKLAVIEATQALQARAPALPAHQEKTLEQRAMEKVLLDSIDDRRARDAEHRAELAKAYADGVAHGESKVNRKDSGMGYLPVIDRVFTHLGNMSARAPSSPSLPAAQPQQGEAGALNTDFVSYVVRAIKARTPAPAALDMLEGLFGQAAMRNIAQHLAANQQALLTDVLAHPDGQAIMADPFAHKWLEEAVAKIGEYLAELAPQQTATPAPAPQPQVVQ